MGSRQRVLAALTSPAFRWAFRGWKRDTLPIVMLHRFTENPVPGRTSAGELDAALAIVRREGLKTLSLGQVGMALRRGTLPERSVCFTVDDGYRDFKDHAAAVFSRYDAPVTVFLTTGFVGGGAWNWWDRVHIAFARAPKRWTELQDALGRPFAATDDRRNAAEQMVASCKEVPDTRRREALQALERALDVELPQRPTEGYAAMDWDDVRRLSASGVEFGPHTVSHPILSRLDDTTRDEELDESFKAVESVTGAPVRVFAYPNGRARDYDEATVEALKRRGVEIAVTTEPGFVDRGAARGREALYHLPRIGLPLQPARQRALFCGLGAFAMALGR